MSKSRWLHEEMIKLLNVKTLLYASRKELTTFDGHLEWRWGPYEAIVRVEWPQKGHGGIHVQVLLCCASLFGWTCAYFFAFGIILQSIAKYVWISRNQSQATEIEGVCKAYLSLFNPFQLVYFSLQKMTVNICCCRIIVTCRPWMLCCSWSSDLSSSVMGCRQVFHLQQG